MVRGIVPDCWTWLWLNLQLSCNLLCWWGVGLTVASAGCSVEDCICCPCNMCCVSFPMPLRQTAFLTWKGWLHARLL